MSRENFKVQSGLNIPALTTAGVVTVDSYGTLSSVASLSISQGGTGQTTAGAALNALLPSQSGQSTLFLTTDGSNPTWGQVFYQTLQNAGTPVTQRAKLNIVGATFADDPTNNVTTITITGGGGSGSGASIALSMALAQNYGYPN
jgi:hypothetical protein